MNPPTFMMPRLLFAALGAGVWVVVSGMLMAAAFGYRDMKQAFDAIGLPLPQGLEPLIVHTLVRLILGAAVVVALVVLATMYPPAKATLMAAGFVWVLATVLPYAVIADWGVLPWSLAIKLWTWSAAEVLIAAMIGRVAYFGLGGAGTP